MALLKDFQSCNSELFVDLPQMYDFATERPKRSSKLKTLNLKTIPDLSDSNSSEMSFNLQIQNQVPNSGDQTSQRPSVPVSVMYGFLMPQTTGFSSDHSESAAANVKQAPDSTDVSTYCHGYEYSDMSHMPNNLDSAGYIPASSYRNEENKNYMDNETDKHSKRRERKIIAVGHYRAMSKQRRKVTEKRVAELEWENEMLRFEISVLKDLLPTVEE